MVPTWLSPLQPHIMAASPLDVRGECVAYVVVSSQARNGRTSVSSPGHQHAWLSRNIDLESAVSSVPLLGDQRDRAIPAVLGHEDNWVVVTEALPLVMGLQCDDTEHRSSR